MRFGSRLLMGSIAKNIGMKRQYNTYIKVKRVSHAIKSPSKAIDYKYQRVERKASLLVNIIVIVVFTSIIIGIVNIIL